MSITPDEEPLEEFEPQPFEDENIADGDTDA